MTYADVNGVSLYYESHGDGGVPLVLLHGGLGSGEMFAPLLPQLTDRRVLTVDLQGHGHTADIDRPFDPVLMADDIAALVSDFGVVDVLGYSLGGGVALRLAIQHPAVLRRLVLVSVPCTRNGSYPEVVAAMAGFGPHLAEPLKQAPLYQSYLRDAPDPAGWDALITKTGELLSYDYDWSADVAKLAVPTMLVYADADSVRPDHIVEFWALLGGGKQDAGVDGSARPVNQLTIIPGATHYDVLTSPVLAPAVRQFLG